MAKEKEEIVKGRTLNILLRVWGFTKPYLGLFGLSIILNVLFSFFSGISIAIIKPTVEIITQSQITNEVSKDAGFLENVKNQFFQFIQHFVYNPENSIETLVRLSLLIILLFVLKNIFKYAGSITNVKLQESIVKSIRDTLFRKLTSLSVEFFTKNKSGSVISILTNDVNVVNQSTIIVISMVFRDVTEIIIYILILLSVSPKLTLIAFSTTILSFGILKYGLQFLRKYASRMQNAMADFTSVLQESISGIRVVKGYNAEKRTNKQFESQTAKYVKSAIKYERIIALIPSINEIFAILALCVVFYVGGAAVLNGEMRSDDLMLFLFSLFAIMSPTVQLFNNLSRFQRGVVSAQRLFTILDQEPTVQTGKEKIKKFEKSINVEDVSFAYNSDKVVKNATFSIEKGKSVAFVGASGSGKSTMLDLLIRFYDPTNGDIKIDGKSITELDIVSYRSLFGIVAQETILFNDTIANNIRYGSPEATIEQIENASIIANAYDFIMNLPNGFDTTIGDRGIMLSGGERQRIAIARALIRNPYILIFDEATSALDAESERIVQTAMTKSLKDRTAIIVAHRLATIIDCDLILVFDKGKIVEHGTHQELLTMNGIYKNLYDLQFAGGNGSS